MANANWAHAFQPFSISFGSVQSRNTETTSFRGGSELPHGKTIIRLRYRIRERECLQQPDRIYHLCPPQSNSELVSVFSNPLQPESFQ